MLALVVVRVGTRAGAGTVQEDELWHVKDGEWGMGNGEWG
jgi:hypothetical protein